jgi:hypothetical protein
MLEECVMTDRPATNARDATENATLRPAQQISRELDDALARVREDMARVEMWANALSCFAQPIPQYEPDNTHLLPAKGQR